MAIDAQKAGMPDNKMARVDCVVTCFAAAAALAAAAGAAPLLLLLMRAVPESMLLMMMVSQFVVPMADTTAKPCSSRSSRTHGDEV
jgi:hypothetical protein